MIHRHTKPLLQQELNPDFSISCAALNIRGSRTQLKYTVYDFFFFLIVCSQRGCWCRRGSRQQRRGSLSAIVCPRVCACVHARAYEGVGGLGGGGGRSLINAIKRPSPSMPSHSLSPQHRGWEDHPTNLA